jgi:hypothetical protein
MPHKISARLPDHSIRRYFMTHQPTTGAWRASPLRQSGASWPFDWTGEITAIDPAARSHRFVATVRQSGSCPLAEAQTNLRVMLRATAQVLDMSNPDHDAFVDSGADCLDALLRQERAIRQILHRIAGSPLSAAA